MRRYGGDYKYGMQMEAEEIAMNEFGCEFYNLPPATQQDVYRRGMEAYNDKSMAEADALNDRMKEEK